MEYESITVNLDWMQNIEGDSPSMVSLQFLYSEILFGFSVQYLDLVGWQWDYSQLQKAEQREGIAGATLLKIGSID